jgi:hypothetical protein
MTGSNPPISSTQSLQTPFLGVLNQVNQQKQEELERKRKQEESDKDAMDVDKESEKKEGQVESFKPPPGWKPGDPLRPEHLQYLYKMSTLSRKTSTPPEPTPPPPSPPPPIKIEQHIPDTKLMGTNSMIKTETKYPTIPTTAYSTPPTTSTSNKIKQEPSIPTTTASTTADDLLTEWGISLLLLHLDHLLYLNLSFHLLVPIRFPMYQTRLGQYLRD